MNIKQLSFLPLLLIATCINATRDRQGPYQPANVPKADKTGYRPVNRKPKVSVSSIGQVWSTNTEGEAFRGFLREGEPIVIMKAIGSPIGKKSGDITVNTQKNILKDDKLLPENNYQLKFGDDDIHAYFTRCNGFSVIEEHDDYYLHGDKDQLFNPCKNIRVKMALKNFLKEELKAKNQQK